MLQYFFRLMYGQMLENSKWLFEAMRGIGGGGAMQSAYRRHTFTLSFAVLHYHHLVHPLFTVLSVIIDGDYSLCLPSLHTTQALRVRVQRGSVKGKYGN